MKITLLKIHTLFILKMAIEFRFPDVGEGIKEGEIVKWHVKEGDEVKTDQVLGEIETDKAVVDIPAPQAGRILKILVKQGQKVKVGEVMLVIGKKGEKYVPGKSAKDEKKIEAGKGKPGKAYGVVGELEVAPEGETLAMPRTRRIAEELGVDLSQYQGVVREGDLMKKAGQEKPSVPLVKKKYDMYGYIDRIPLKGIRKVIAEKMSEAQRIVPLVTHMDEIIMDELSKVREEKKKEAEKQKIKLTYLPFIIKALILSFKDHMIFNSIIEGEEIIIKKYFNIGVAVDTPDGLMVPAVKGADQKDIFQLASEIEILADKARRRKIDPADLHGGTFTITNIGSVGGKFFTPIVNYPETSILGLGRMDDKVFFEDGKIIVRKTLPVSFSFDHRIADGGSASRFLNQLKEHLENPRTLKLD